MHLVTLECRECTSEVEFASSFMADAQPTLNDMQYHMDLNFLARCGKCFAGSWEVLDIKPCVFPHGALDIVV